jgi:DNA-binding beta-propeller fold protein YncE
VRRFLVPAILIAACLAPAAPAVAEVQFLRQFGGEEGKKPGQFRLPDGIGADTAGNIFVADSQNNRIQKFTPDGRVLPFALAKVRWGQRPGEFKIPYDVDADALGNIFVADTENSRIQKFTPEGRFLWMRGRNGGDGTTGAGPGEFDQPRGMAIDKDGNAWIADHNNARVLKFDTDGKLLLTIGANGGDGSYGDGIGEFNSPRGICTDDKGFVYVADDANHRMVKLRGDTGQFVAIFGKPGGSTGGFGTALGEFQLPYGCAVDNKRGHLWVADTKNNRAVQLTTDGIFLRNWGANGGDGTAGEGPAEFDEPYNAGSDCAGNVYISDEHSKRIEVFGDPGDPRPVCPPGLTISGAKASLGAKRVTVNATCDRICRVVARVTVRDTDGRLVKRATREVILAGGVVRELVVRFPGSVAQRLKRGARVSLRVTASGAPGADRVRPKTLKLGQ